MDFNNYMSFDDVYTDCPNCGAYVDRWDIENGHCSSCKRIEEITEK